MKPITIFDLISDQICWIGDCCCGCGKNLPTLENINEQEVIVRMHLNKDQKLVCILYHADCWRYLLDLMKPIGDKIV